jgi:hypothetical protein
MRRNFHLPKPLLKVPKYDPMRFVEEEERPPSKPVVIISGIME